jgi:hypothetical protein
LWWSARKALLPGTTVTRRLYPDTDGAQFVLTLDPLPKLGISFAYSFHQLLGIVKLTDLVRFLNLKIELEAAVGQADEGVPFPGTEESARIPEYLPYSPQEGYPCRREVFDS